MSEQMNLVIVGHVDHGKSTFIGRLLADTGSLPEGKLEQVKATCQKNAKPFEYAFLLDALKDEQSQGITIDTARCFFKTKKRHYIVIDAPGHVEFLKNMVTGAARAEAALLLIDAKEGVQENSRRHGYMLSLLGIKQVVVLVNKMDLVAYNEVAFNTIKNEYSKFLKEIHIDPINFVPITAFHGDNLVEKSIKMSWYTGPVVIDEIDAFKKEESKSDKPLRFPVQDIYKFTEHNDDRRIIAGQVCSGRFQVGDEVIFFPSQKKSVIHSIESFNTPRFSQKEAGDHAGITLKTQIYIKPGELMAKCSEPAPSCSNTIKVNLFWLGKRPMVQNKKYKLKISSAREIVYLKEIKSVLDASTLERRTDKTQLDRLDVAECVLQLLKPIAFDCASQEESTSRFVIVDQYDIAGGGIITQALDETEEDKKRYNWEKSAITPEERAKRLGQKPTLIVLTGSAYKVALAKALEKALFDEGKTVYYLGVSNLLSSLNEGLHKDIEEREDHIHRLSELASLFTESGLVMITTISNLDDREARLLHQNNQGMLLINVGENHFHYTHVDFQIHSIEDIHHNVDAIKTLLSQKYIFGDFSI